MLSTFCNVAQLPISLRLKKQHFEILTRSDTNQPVQPQKMVGSLKFGIEEEERLCYLCSEIKCADQLCSYCTADLRLWFRMCKLLVCIAAQLLVLSVVM